MNKVYNIDIDGIICTNNYGNYKEAKPIKKNIEKINSLYYKGNLIEIYTARGSTTGMDWRELTEKQLEEWGVKYHKLTMGKPYYDFIIDDKAILSW